MMLTVDLLLWVGGSIDDDTPTRLREAGFGYLVHMLRSSPVPKHRALRVVSTFASARSGLHVAAGVWAIPCVEGGPAAVRGFARALGPSLTVVASGRPDGRMIEAARSEARSRSDDIDRRLGGDRPRLAAIDADRRSLDKFKRAWGIDDV